MAVTLPDLAPFPDPSDRENYQTNGATYHASLRAVINAIRALTAEQLLSGNIGVEGGVQEYNNVLAAIGALTLASNKLMSFDAAGDPELIDLTEVARTLLVAATDVDQRTALGLGYASLAEALGLAATDRVISPERLGQVLGFGGRVVASVSFNGTTGAILSAANVSAVTRDGQGQYTITFQTALASAGYRIFGTTGNTAIGAATHGLFFEKSGSKTTANAQVYTGFHFNGVSPSSVDMPVVDALFVM